MAARRVARVVERDEPRAIRCRDVWREPEAFRRAGEVRIDRGAAVEEGVVEIEDDRVERRQERGAKRVKLRQRETDRSAITSGHAHSSKSGSHIVSTRCALLPSPPPGAASPPSTRQRKLRQRT